jgi:poly-gamma-glutamate synthesis protein (capsule biosynthesis protein)
VTYHSDVYQPTILELARQGNLQAIAYWLNGYLAPRGICARIQPFRARCLQVQVELPHFPNWETSANLLSEHLARFICHCLWKLDSTAFDGVKIATHLSGESAVLWNRSIRLVTPSTRLTPQQSKQLRLKLRQTAQHRARLKLLRSLLLSGSTATAFILGCWLGYSDAPIEQTTATASPSPTSSSASVSLQHRPDNVQAALESVPVVRLNQVATPQDPTVTLMFGGDVTLSDAFAELVGQDYDWAFAELEEYRQADVAMVNLEGTLTRAENPLPDKQFHFKADPESVKVLSSGGVDLVTLGNNHAMDYEAVGLEETMATLDRAGIHHIGAGRDIKEARRPEILEVKGQRIAYLGYYDADLHAAGEGVAGTNPRHNQRVAEDIKAIRNQVDWVIVNYHWGEELADYPGDWQMELAHFTIDQGADLVVGHHPHVLQGTEIYKGKPIVYSLGNFIFGGNSRSDYDTAALKVSLRDKQMKVELLPIAVKKYQPHVLTGERGKAILDHVQQISDIFDQPMQASMILNPRSLPAPTAATTKSTTAGPKASPQPFIQAPSSTAIDDFKPEPAVSPTPETAPSSAAPAETVPPTNIPTPESTPPSTSSRPSPNQTLQSANLPPARVSSIQLPVLPTVIGSGTNTGQHQPVNLEQAPVAPTTHRVGQDEGEQLPNRPALKNCSADAPAQSLGDPLRRCYAQKTDEPNQTKYEPESILESAPWAFSGM